MRVLVTGWAGYVGPVLIRRLREAGHYVIGLDTGWFLDRYAGLPVYPDEAVFGDIREPAYEGDVDVVVHLAGLSNDPLGDLDPILTNEINAVGTQWRIRDRLEARHVIVSSCSVYGTAEMATEETPVAPLTEYAKAKADVDRWAFSLSSYRSPNAVSLRLGTVYGWSPGHRLDLVVNRMTYDAVHGLGITVNGNAARPLVHVEDVARAIVFMLDRPETGIYNVVGENWRMGDLAETVAWATKAQIRKAAPSADARDYQADGSKLRALGFDTEWGVGDTLADLAELSVRLGVRSRYERLNAIRNLIDSGQLTSDLRRKETAAA